MDEVRRAPKVGRATAGCILAEKLKKMRWKLLRKGGQVHADAPDAGSARPAPEQAGHRPGLDAPRKPSKTSGATARWLWAGGFLDVWMTRALRSHLEPMKKVAQMLRSHA